MKIFVIAIALLIFSGVVTLYNELGIFDQKLLEPGLHNISQSDVTEVFKPDSNGEVTSGGLINDIMGIPGFAYKILGVVWKLLGNTFDLGSVFAQYVPGIVGTKIGTFITVITWFFYAWGGIQLWQKVSTKNMD